MTFAAEAAFKNRAADDEWRVLIKIGDKGHAIPVVDVKRITFDSEQCGGRPCIRGMRIRVKDVLDMPASGANEGRILADFPDLEVADIRACLQYAAAQANRAVLQAA
jgi:uncharacterized protein (DUF433 family)